jgi:hypothetical protein
MGVEGLRMDTGSAEPRWERRSAEKPRSPVWQDFFGMETATIIRPERTSLKSARHNGRPWTNRPELRIRVLVENV